MRGAIKSAAPPLGGGLGVYWGQFRVVSRSPFTLSSFTLCANLQDLVVYGLSHIREVLFQSSSHIREVLFVQISVQSLWRSVQYGL